MVSIVTDSTSDIPPDIARELNITVIPVHGIFGKRKELIKRKKKMKKK